MEPAAVGIEVILDGIVFDTDSIKGRECRFGVVPGVSFEFEELYVALVALMVQNGVAELVKGEGKAIGGLGIVINRLFGR